MQRFLLALLLSASTCVASASIFLPGGSARSLSVGLGGAASSPSSSSSDAVFHRRRALSRAVARQRHRCAGRSDGGGALRHPLAYAIPGNSVAEQVVVGGFGNFISIYNTVITARILLSWFPQAQSVGFLQPVFGITDPYLNLFRGIIPPVFGLDLSPILAFVTLNLLQTSMVSLAADIPEEGKLMERIRMLEKKGRFMMLGEFS